MFNFSKTAATAFVVMASAFGVSAADHLTIIGSATPDSWNIKYGLLMVQDVDNENVFTYMGYLKADEEFKFTSGKNFDNPNLEYQPTLMMCQNSFKAGRITNSRFVRVPIIRWFAIWLT